MSRISAGAGGLVCLCALLTGIASHTARGAPASDLGTFIQFDIPANADVVAEGPDSEFPTVTDGIDNGGSSFLSQSQAVARGGPAGRGLPDDGRIGNIQLLPYDQMNVARRDWYDTSPIEIFSPIGGHFSSITIYATIGSSTGSMLTDVPVIVESEYILGPAQRATIRVPDWFQDPPGIAYLIDGLDRTAYTGGPLDEGFQNVKDAAIFAFRIPADPRREMWGLELTKADYVGILNVFAVSGTLVPVPEPAAVALLPGLALLLRRRPGTPRRACPELLLRRSGAHRGSP